MRNVEWSPAAIINEELRIPHSTFFIAAKRESLKTHNSKFKNSRTMKKEYINPKLALVKLQTMQMLASSTNLVLSEIEINL
jgi:uncharacterized protein YfaT (DUF1175 family)